MHFFSLRINMSIFIIKESNSPFHNKKSNSPKGISNSTPYFTPKLRKLSGKWSDEQKIKALLYKWSNPFIFCSLLHFPLHFLNFGVKYGVGLKMP